MSALKTFMLEYAVRMIHPLEVIHAHIFRFGWTNVSNEYKTNTIDIRCQRELHFLGINKF